MSTAAALDPAETIRALAGELHDAVRQLLDTTDREDPTLLDKMRKLSGGLGKKITNARKRVEAEQAPEKPAPSPASKPAEQPTKPAVTTPTGKPVTPAAAEQKTTDTPKRPEPAVAPKPAPAATTPAARRPATTPAAAKSTVVPPAAGTRTGRHRRPDPRPRWPLPVLLIAVLVGLTALFGIGWAIAGAALTAAASLAGARLSRRIASVRLKIKPLGRST